MDRQPHTVVITALRADHYPGTNHEAGREGPLRSTELIYCWDPDGPSDPRGFARADHCDHIHWGLDR